VTPDAKPFDPGVYAEEAAAAIGLTLPAHGMPGVVANLTRLAARADTLLTFALPDAGDRE
jgi:hypothetical protein